uniref:S1 motif domain-containing protein n=1 Tax=Alexandrium monilatum TaxID=311494 RepID=A0A7S4VEX4_9DINO
MMWRRQEVPRCRRLLRPTKVWLACLCAASVAAAHFCAARLAFASGRLSPAGPHAARFSSQASRSGRIARASRGGEASGGFQVGDRVRAVSPDDERRYPGVVEGSNDDGTYTVRWDDAGGGPETSDVEPQKMRKVVVFKDYAAGDDVQAMSPGDGQWYPGSVEAANADGTFQVRWDDPDGGPETEGVKPEAMKKVTVFRGYKVEDVVEAVFPDDGQMYPGRVAKANADGTFQVRWDDPEGGPEESPVRPRDMRYPPIPLEDLRVGQKFRGTVRSIMDFGAFVDIGAAAHGLVHISRIAKERVGDVDDYLEEGQEVDVWVSAVRKDGKLGLSMVESRIGDGGGEHAPPSDLEAFGNISPEEWLDGTVSGIVPFGVFVTARLPDGAAQGDGLVHISRVRRGFVESVEDEFEIGQQVRVRVESVDFERKRLSLTMRGSGAGNDDDDTEAPPDLSAFTGISPDQWLTGKVLRIAPFGAFVGLTAEDGTAADGLVHRAQIKDGFVESIDDELEVGQEVQVRILSVDAAAGKMKLSMKSPGF